MNDHTVVAVCGYAGDAFQVKQNMPLYKHHGCPVVVLSPVDSKIELPETDCRFGGKRAYIGQDSLDRQQRHLELLWDMPGRFFFVNDSDSFCLSPELPRYLYDKPEVLWSNLVIDNIPGRGDPYPPGWPHIAFQPPYFFSRDVLWKMLSVGRVEANPVLPFIDFYMVQLAMLGKIPYAGFPDGISCGTMINDPKDGTPGQPHPIGSQIIGNAVRDRGTIFIHSVKHIDVVHQLVGQRDQYLRLGPRVA